MAFRKLLVLRNLRRRSTPPNTQHHQLHNTLSSSYSFSRPLHNYSSPSSYSHPLRNPNSHFSPVFSSTTTTTVTTSAALSFSRPFSTRQAAAADSVQVATELPNLGVDLCGEESIFPVSALISLLGGYHHLTAFPWWIIIVSSTLGLRIILFPLLILQLTKLKKIAELFPKLPPPLPPPLSGISYKDQLMLFMSERKAVGCPSFMWFIAYIVIQFPCFLLWMTTIRRMALDHHPGFDCGGALWFKNLSELPHGVVGAIFPLLIAGLHFVNIQVSFQTISAGKVSGLLGFLVKTYKLYLDVLTLPIFFAGFCIPQGSLVYWLTNSSISLIQQLCLNNPRVRNHLGLPDQQSPVTASDTQDGGAPVILLDSSRSERKVSIQNQSPHELVILSIQLLSKGSKDKAILLLRLALRKDPEHIRALIIMGQILLQDGMLIEATEHLERAISRLFLMGPTEIAEVDLLIVASQWAGESYMRQGKKVEAMIHFERLGRMKEPEDAKSKAHYYEGLLMLASALTNEGRKVEAAKYLRMAVAYDPANKVYLEQLENEEDNFISDLVDSRRGNY